MGVGENEGVEIFITPEIILAPEEACRSRDKSEYCCFVVAQTTVNCLLRLLIVS